MLGRWFRAFAVMLLAGFAFLVLGIVGYFMVVNLLGQLFGSGRLL